jgi:hypothetical protein
MTTINDIRTAYEEGEGRWTGCDWPTHYGCLGLDLEGVPSGRAHRTASRWRVIAAGGGADDITTGEEASLVDMAEHLRLRRVVLCVYEGQGCRLVVRGKSARLCCADALAWEWEFAGHWLEEIESDARWAEGEAREAVAAAERGDWDYALRHACQACSVESGYGDPRPWRHLKQVIEKAAT